MVENSEISYILRIFMTIVERLAEITAYHASESGKTPTRGWIILNDWMKLQASINDQILFDKENLMKYVFLFEYSEQIIQAISWEYYLNPSRLELYCLFETCEAFTGWKVSQYGGFSWSVYPNIHFKYGKKRTRKSSVSGHFLCSDPFVTFNTEFFSILGVLVSRKWSLLL